MRSEENSLDLNNLPEEYGRDGKQIMEEHSDTHMEASDTTRCRKKKSGGKDDCGKVYECRFCSLKFCKSQALGGHMNRHRQERETETLNRARQLVFSNDSNLGAQGGPHIGLRDMNVGHQSNNMIDPSLQYRSNYPTRIFPSSSPTVLSPMQQPPPPPPPQAYLYPPSSRLMSHYPPHSMNDYFLGRVLPPNAHGQQSNANYSPRGVESSYACVGAPLGREYQSSEMDLSVSSGGGGSLRNYASGTTQCFDHSSINRFHDGV